MGYFAWSHEIPWTKSDGQIFSHTHKQRRRECGVRGRNQVVIETSVVSFHPSGLFKLSNTSLSPVTPSLPNHHIRAQWRTSRRKWITEKHLFSITKDSLGSGRLSAKRLSVLSDYISKAYLRHLHPIAADKVAVSTHRNDKHWNDRNSSSLFHFLHECSAIRLPNFKLWL